jgi:hypothetical protein
MTITALLTLLPMLLSIGGSAAGDQPRVRTLVVQDQLIVRVPISPPRGHIEWTDREGPNCISARAIRGAMLSGSDSVDFILGRGQRVRAQLSSDCPALDFYDGFYLKPDDHRVCADRDVIRSRMGGSCRIEQFRLLAPKR